MSDELHHDDERFGAEALAALKASSSVSASSDARARAKAAFLDAASDAAPAVEAAPSTVLSLRRPLISVAIAASVVFVGWFGSSSDVDWIVTAIDNGTDVLVDGAATAVGHRYGAVHVSNGEGTEFEIQLGESLRLRMVPGTEADVPAGPGRWFQRERTLYVTSGEVFGTSASTPLGYSFTLQTPEAKATLTGTTFAVIRQEDATCFCLWEGSLEIERADGLKVELPAGRRVFIYADGRDPEIQEMVPGERMKLDMMSTQGIMDRDQ